MNNCNDKSIPKEDGDSSLGELQYDVEVKEKAQTNEISEELKEMDTLKMESEVEGFVEELHTTAEGTVDRKSFANVEETFIELAEKQKIAELPNLGEDETLGNANKKKQVNIEDKESLIQEDKVEVETIENHVPTI